MKLTQEEAEGTAEPVCVWQWERPHSPLPSQQLWWEHKAQPRTQVLYSSEVENENIECNIEMETAQDISAMLIWSWRKW